MYECKGGNIIKNNLKRMDLNKSWNVKLKKILSILNTLSNFVPL